MPAHLRHGHGNHPDYYYNLWRRIRQCCYDKNYQAYHNYGARGIIVYEPWRNSFEQFLQGLIEDVGMRPSPNHSLDRKDNDGHYEPGNLKWSTVSEQGRNCRGNRTATVDGQTKTIAEWSEISGVRWYNIGRRLDWGWDERRAVFQPERKLPKANERLVTVRRANPPKAAIADFTPAQWASLQAAFHHCCAYCGIDAKGELTQDHITPLSKGGNHTLSNIVPACQSCNSKKWTGEPLMPIQPLLIAE